MATWTSYQFTVDLSGSIGHDGKCALYFLSRVPMKAELIGRLCRQDGTWVSGLTYSLQDSRNGIARNQGNTPLLIKIMWMSHRHVPFRFHQATLHSQDCSFREYSPDLFSNIDFFKIRWKESTACPVCGQPCFWPWTFGAAKGTKSEQCGHHMRQRATNNTWNAWKHHE